MNIVSFQRIGENRYIPMQPWPQSFYISGDFLRSDEIEVRPLTLMGLIKGVGRNFITMNYWRCMYMFRRIGFLSTPEDKIMSFKDWSWHPIQTRRERSIGE